MAEFIGPGGELHQVAGGTHPQMTTNQGMVIGDDENSLRANPRGPTLLEDISLLEKLQHFNHERIPERVVHARGTAARGYFELTDSLAEFTRAAAVAFVHDAFAHLKVIGHTPGVKVLMDKAGVVPDAGIVALDAPKTFIATASKGRVWDREPSVRTVF